jgi:hypothetical protein
VAPEFLAFTIPLERTEHRPVDVIPVACLLQIGTEPLSRLRRNGERVVPAAFAGDAQ